MSKTLKAHIAVLFANLIYGANYSIAKTVMPQFIKPFGFIVIRVGIAALLFLLTALLIKEKVETKDKWRLCICAIFGVTINQLFFFKGLSLTSPINSGLIMVTNPIFVMILSAVFLNELINLKKITGIICGLSGATLLILFANHLANSGSSLAGDLCILINSLSYAVFIVMVKPMMNKYHPVTVMKYVFLFAVIFVTPVGWNEFSSIKWNSFTAEIWLSTAFVVIGTTYLAYLFNTLALKELSAGTVSVYIYLQPLLAAAFAILLGKDSLNYVHVIAALLIFSGVYLSTAGSVVKNKIVLQE